MSDCLEPLKEHVITYVDNILRQQEAKKRVRDWLEKQRSEYAAGALPVELDFKGMQDYLSYEIQADVRRYFFGSLDEQEKARTTMIAKACDRAKAVDGTARSRVEHITNSVLDIMRQYAWENMDESFRFMLGEYSRNMEKAILRAVRQNRYPEQMEHAQVHAEPQKTFGVYKKPRRTAYYITSDCNDAICSRMESQDRLLIMGMPGIGKTEGVLWYLEQAGYESVVWLNFETFEQSIKSMGDFLIRISGTLEKWEGEKEDIIAGMLELLAERLGEYENAVVIFDNVNNKELLKLLADIEFPCRIILTSWLNYHYGYFLDTEVLHWKGLNMDRSRVLFQEMTGIGDLEGHEKDIQELLCLCEGIPLVIRQAAAYIMESRISVEQYTSMCREAATLKFGQADQKDLHTNRKNANVCATFYLPFRALREETGGDEEFLHLFSAVCFLHSEGISEELLLKVTGLPFDRFNDALSRILRFSLIERCRGRVFMKQIVQDILLSFLDDAEKAWAVAQIGRVLSEEFLKLPLLNRVLDRFSELGMNGIGFLNVVRNIGLELEEMPQLLLGGGSYYYLQGFFSLGQQYLRQALDLSKMQADWRLRFRILSVLGEVWEEAGDNDAAMDCIAGIRGDRERMLEEEPLVVVQGLIAEAHIYENLRQYGRALELVEQALKIIRDRKSEYAEGYELSADICRMNIFNQLKLYDDAVQVFETAGKTFEFTKEQIPGDILVVELYASMANSLLCQGQVQEALDCYRRQLEFYQKYYQNKYHPAIAYVCGNIAIAYMEIEALEEAEMWLDRALEILRRSAPSHHEMLLQIYFRLAVVRYRLGDYEAAWGLFGQALDENHFVSDSDRRKRLEINAGILMACTRYGRGLWDEALKLLEDVYAEEIQAGIQDPCAAQLMQNHEYLVQEVTAGKRIEDMVLMDAF